MQGQNDHQGKAVFGLGPIKMQRLVFFRSWSYFFCSMLVLVQYVSFWHQMWNWRKYVDHLCTEMCPWLLPAISRFPLCIKDPITVIRGHCHGQIHFILGLPKFAFCHTPFGQLFALFAVKKNPSMFLSSSWTISDKGSDSTLVSSKNFFTHKKGECVNRCPPLIKYVEKPDYLAQIDQRKKWQKVLWKSWNW